MSKGSLFFSLRPEEKKYVYLNPIITTGCIYINKNRLQDNNNKTLTMSELCTVETKNSCSVKLSNLNKHESLVKTVPVKLYK